MESIRIEIIIENPEVIKSNMIIRLGKECCGLVAETEQKAATDFFDFMHNVIQDLKKNGSIRTAEAYMSALRSFERFLDNKELTIDKFDSDLAVAYECYLRQNGVQPNSTSFYMRILRAVYHRAVEKGLTADRRPFAHVYTSTAKTKKRAVSLDCIKQLARLECKRRNECLARDLFLFSFYTRGMSFVDIAYLQKQDIKDGVLYYTRSKTGQRLAVKWEPMMQRIIDSHPTQPNSPYLFPIIVNMKKNPRNQYRHKMCTINKELRKLGERIKMTDRLTMYVARHSWASIAKSLDVPVEVISQAMGHTSERTTQIYLKSIGNERVDQANHCILESLNMTDKE